MIGSLYHRYRKQFGMHAKIDFHLLLVFPEVRLFLQESTGKTDTWQFCSDQSYPNRFDFGKSKEVISKPRF